MTKTLQEIWREEPLRMKQALWPNIQLYDKQIEIIHSVRDNIETYVPAGNMLGKDFISAFIAVWFYVAHYQKPTDPSAQASVRVVTTSVKSDHLGVLWAEIARYVSGSAHPLLSTSGGPLVLNSQEIRHVYDMSISANEINYVKGLVSETGEGLQGHHAKYTLWICDEASGVRDNAYTMAKTWAKKILIIGNPHQCTNFFYKNVKAGDLLETE